MTRGFESVRESQKKYGFERFVILPIKATRGSACYDFVAPIDIVLQAGEKQMIWTNVKAYMLEDEVLQLFPRSSMGIKGLGLMNTVGIIDSTYYSNPKNDGNIGAMLVNNGSETIVIKAGERFIQGMFSKYLIIDGEKEREDELAERIGGFGSTN